MRYKDFDVRLGGKVYRQVSKRQAFKKHLNGEDIYTIPCKMNPYSHWCRFFRINQDCEFVKTVNLIEGVNCNNEVGNYLNYFILL